MVGGAGVGVGPGGAWCRKMDAHVGANVLLLSAGTHLGTGV